MPNLGAPELLLIALIVLLLFGASRLPKLGRSMGQSIRGFKKGLNEAMPDDEDEKAEKVQVVEAKKDEPVQVVEAKKDEPVQVVEVKKDDEAGTPTS
jgi:sec-independent protein translocase protein TatA